MHQCRDQRVPGGWELRPKGDPEPAGVHDFAIRGLGKVAPYGVYDIAAYSGWINLAITHDTAAFAVESIRRRWQELGQPSYSQARQLLITVDCGGSHRAWVRPWKLALQRLADETGLAITVAHLTAGTSSRVDDWHGGGRSRG
jgi:Rhodopirellula transposase DDE domain